MALKKRIAADHLNCGVCQLSGFNMVRLQIHTISQKSGGVVAISTPAASTAAPLTWHGILASVTIRFAEPRSHFVASESRRAIGFSGSRLFGPRATPKIATESREGIRLQVSGFRSPFLTRQSKAAPAT